MPADQSYTTLSRCWGSTPIHTLVTNNYRDFLQHVPVDRLPKVSKDAITVTGRAGFDYLWIDSLCIIQDSAEDWATESMILGSIYENAVCSLAATGFEDGSRGLFVKRPLARLKPIECFFKGNITIENDIVLQEGKHFLVDRDMWVGEWPKHHFIGEHGSYKNRCFRPEPSTLGQTNCFGSSLNYLRVSFPPKGFPSVLRFTNMKSCIPSRDSLAHYASTLSSKYADHTAWTGWFFIVLTYSRG